MAAGLPRALAKLAERCPIPTRVIVDNGVCPPDIAATLYFATAEALANAAKHAGAGSVRVDVRHASDRVSWSVTDDGTGGANPARGTGLLGLADRIEAVGGTLRITSAGGAGTVLAAELPLRPRAPDQ